MGEGEEKLAVIIEDDADVRHLLKTVLTQSGFETILTSNGEDGIDAVRTYNPILTTLDVSMPGMDGFAAAKRIREFSTTYIVMLTALADEIDIVQGLDSGADDYLLKPFRPRELRARIETMMRRPRERVGVLSNFSQSAVEEAPAAVSPPPYEPAPLYRAQPTPPPAQAAPAPQPAQPAQPVHEPVYQQQAPPAPQPVAYEAPAAFEAPVDRAPRLPVHEPAPVAPPAPQQFAPQQPAPQQAPPAQEPAGAGWLEHRGLRLNPQTRLTQVDGRGIELTRSEFDLLAALLGSGRRVRSKADLVLALRGETYVTTYYVNDADKRAVEVHMANLRRKIGDSTATPRFIETVRGVGYRLASDRDQ